MTRAAVPTRPIDMRLIVQCSGVVDGQPQFRAWLRDGVTHSHAIVSVVQVELSGVAEVIGWDAATARRMGWPEEVFVRWERGSLMFPRELVDVLPEAQATIGDGRTVEGERK